MTTAKLIKGKIVFYALFTSFIDGWLGTCQVVSVPLKAGTHHSSETWKPPIFLGDFFEILTPFHSKTGISGIEMTPICGKTRGFQTKKTHFHRKTKGIKVLIDPFCENRRYCLKSDSIMWNHGDLWVKHPFFGFHMSVKTCEMLEKKHPFLWNWERWYVPNLSNYDTTGVACAICLTGANLVINRDARWQGPSVWHLRFPKSPVPLPLPFLLLRASL